MILDPCFIQEFVYAEKEINKYDNLMNFFKQFTKEHYEKMNIFIQKHHITPSFECEDLDKTEYIWLPVPFHFKAHILRAREYKEVLTDSKTWMPDLNEAFETLITGNYTEAYCILRPYKELHYQFNKEYKEAEKHYQKYFKAKTYEAYFGKRKANIIKRKISNTMKNLDLEIINKRSENIAKYANNRPKEHNNAISEAKQKTVYNITTGKYYKNAEEASKETGICLSMIRKCCQGKIEQTKNMRFEYF